MNLTEAQVSERLSMSFPMACVKFFEKLPGQTTVQFAAELKALSTVDKDEFIQMFKAIGYEITPAPK